MLYREKFSTYDPEHPKRIPFSPRGCVVEVRYRLTRDGNYNSIYEEKESVDIQEYVNSFANGCSLRSVLERCSLMPINDKVNYLNQSQGVSADLTSMPKTGVDAYIMLSKLNKDFPDFFKRIAAGESFSALINEKFGSKNDYVKKPESEVINNGEN